MKITKAEIGKLPITDAEHVIKVLKVVDKRRRVARAIEAREKMRRIEREKSTQEAL